jgi:hypothetical protein
VHRTGLSQSGHVWFDSLSSVHAISPGLSSFIVFTVVAPVPWFVALSLIFLLSFPLEPGVTTYLFFAWSALAVFFLPPIDSTLAGCCFIPPVYHTS